MTRFNILLGCLGIAIIAIAPTIFYPILVMKILCFALFASSFNLLVGYTGLLSFGHAAFFGSAGYTLGVSMKLWGFSPEAALLLSVVAAAGLGCLIGSLAIRRQGIYFSMITLALSQLLYFVVQQIPALGRDDGFQGIPRGMLFGTVDLSDDRALYVLVAVCFVLAIAAVIRIVGSPFGQVLEAIRENEPRAISLGYSVNRYKLMAFALSAALAGLAGGLKTLVVSYESLLDLHWSTSGDVILMTLLGGMGTILGPIVGAAFVVTLQNWLADKVGEWVSVIIGAVFLACVLLFRRGFVGEGLALWRRWMSAKRTRVAAPSAGPAAREGGRQPAGKAWADVNA
jgi:branched-chain amino acid transport system permease protein